MHKSKQKSLLLAITALLLTFMTACSGSSTSNSDNNVQPTTQAKASEKPVAEETVKPADPVEITWWNFPNFTALDGEVGKFEKQLIAAFNEKHPNITVNLEMLTFDGGPEKLNVAIATDTAPDVIYDAPGRIIDWAKNGLLAPIDDMFTPEVRGDIEQAIIEQSSVDGTMYMYPFNTGPFT